MTVHLIVDRGPPLARHTPGDHSTLTAPSHPHLGIPLITASSGALLPELSFKLWSRPALRGLIQM